MEDCEARKKARPAFDVPREVYFDFNRSFESSTTKNILGAFPVRFQEELTKQSDDLLEEAKKYEKDRSDIPRLLKIVSQPSRIRSPPAHAHINLSRRVLYHTM